MVMMKATMGRFMFSEAKVSGFVSSGSLDVAGSYPIATGRPRPCGERLILVVIKRGLTTTKRGR
jgi:hypothetical protein